MISKENEKQTKLICNDLKSIYNASFNQIDNFIQLLINTIVHEIVVQQSDNTNGKTNNIDVELPYIGCLHFDFQKGVECEITLEDDFKEKIQKAVFELDSPLIKNAEEKVINYVLDLYKSLL